MKTAIATIAPAILRSHPELDPGQQELIAHLDGPILGIAGPGAGKTLAVALRGANILLREAARPEELALCTYNRAAARELRRRFAALATAAGCPGDPARVRITTIHGLCHRILEPNAPEVGLRAGYRLLNEQEQRQFMLESYDDIFGPEHFGQEHGDLKRRGWRLPQAAVNNGRRYFDRIADELTQPRDLVNGNSAFLAALGRCYGRYLQLLRRRNAVDFAHLQLWAGQLLDDDRLGGPISQGIRHLMCDEYQDTSYVQERILTRLSEAHGNLCVVGDEDQGLYRFRGASVENILRFPDRFPGCRVVELTVNYRSHPAIVDFYDRWMADVVDWSGSDGGPSHRHPKTITPHDPGGYDDYPAVIAIAGRNPTDEGRQLADFLRFLKSNRVIAGYGQAALLLQSVRDDVAGSYLDALDGAGIPARCVPAGGSRGNAGGRRELTVTTIHQAKGREWDVVLVGSLDFDNRNVDPVGRSLRSHCPRPSREPAHLIADFDLARQHYVAFSRPRHLLALTAGAPVHPRFRVAWDPLPRWEDMERSALRRQRFRPADLVANAETDAALAASPRVIPFLKRLDVWVGGRPPGGR